MSRGKALAQQLGTWIFSFIHSLTSRPQLLPICGAAFPLKVCCNYDGQAPSHSISRSFSPSPILSVFIFPLLFFLFFFMKPGFPHRNPCMFHRFILLVTAASGGLWSPLPLQAPLCFPPSLPPCLPLQLLPCPPPLKLRTDLSTHQAAENRLHL